MNVRMVEWEYECQVDAHWGAKFPLNFTEFLRQPNQHCKCFELLCLWIESVSSSELCFSANWTGSLCHRAWFLFCLRQSGNLKEIDKLVVIQHRPTSLWFNSSNRIANPICFLSGRHQRQRHCQKQNTHLATDEREKKNRMKIKAINLAINQRNYFDIWVAAPKGLHS